MELIALIGFLPSPNVYMSLEYTGRGALVHIYGSFYRVGAPFLVSMKSSHLIAMFARDSSIGFIWFTPLGICPFETYRFA